MVFEISMFWWGAFCGAAGLIILMLVLSKLGWLGDSKADDDE